METLNKTIIIPKKKFNINSIIDQFAELKDYISHKYNSSEINNVELSTKNTIIEEIAYVQIDFKIDVIGDKYCV